MTGIGVGAGGEFSRGDIGSAHFTLRASLARFESDLNRARRSAERSSQGINKSLGQVTKQTIIVNQRMHNLNTTVQRLSRQFLVLRAALAAIPAVFGVRAAVQMADAWVMLGARIGQTTDTMEEAAAVQERLFQVAQRSRAPLGSIADTYVRLRLATEEYGLSQEAALVVTESLSKLLVLSGATATEAEGAFRQLTQSFTRGELRGQELASVYEQFPILLRIVARETGTTTSELLKSALDNGLAIDKIINSLISARESIEDQFSKMPVTIAQSLTQLQNALTKAIGITSQAGKAYDALVDTLNELRETVEDPSFQRGLIAIFQVLAFIVKDLANGISRIGKAADIISRLTEGDLGGIWENYLTSTRQAQEATEELSREAQEVQGIDPVSVAGDANEVDRVAEAIERLKRELALEKIPEDYRELNSTFMDLGINAQAFEGFLALGTAATEAQADAATELFNIWEDILRVRRQAALVTTSDVRSDEEANRRMAQLRAQQRQDQEVGEAFDERQSRIDSLSRLPDDIDAADIASRELADTLADVNNLSFDSLMDAFGNIAQQIAEMTLRALIFQAIMRGVGAAAGGAGAAGGAAGAGAAGGTAGAGAAPLFSDAQLGRHGMVVKRMAGGGFITRRPTIIPMATGAAMISEYGQPEAVMPLRRMASGDLGVAAEGGGMGGPTINIDARQSSPGTAAAAVAQAVKIAPGAVVNAQARGLVEPNRKRPF